jgi:hypothetical protein
MKNRSHNHYAIANVRDALDLIEQAQIKLMEACQKLSPIEGAAPQWHRTSNLYVRVKSHWYRIHAWLEKSGTRIDLDPGAKIYVKSGKRL